MIILIKTIVAYKQFDLDTILKVTENIIIKKLQY